MNDFQKVVSFLMGIGIPCIVQPEKGAFLNLIRINRGTLSIDPAAPVCDILHEAGHLALTPGRFRHHMDGDVGKGQKIMLEEMEVMIDIGSFPDHPLYRACVSNSDTDVTAWAWAAGKYIGIADEKIIETGYDLDEDDQGYFKFDKEGNEVPMNGADIVRYCLQTNNYPGIHGLAYAGLCATQKMVAKLSGLPLYPNLKSWTQEL